MKNTGKLRLAVLLACAALVGCGSETQPAQTRPPAQSVSEQSAPASSAEQPAPAENAQSAPTEDEKPQPIYGNQIQDGTYKIEVSSSSSMFRIIDAQLTVAGGEMSAVLTLSGTGYEKLYMGTGEEALADSDDKCIYFVENADGKYTYQVPVAALDQDTDCAAWSIKKKTWYDRTLVFQSSLIPAEAVKPAQETAAHLADGQYLIGVTLSGGTGRTEVETPAKLVVQDGAATATIVWSSPYYEFMVVDGVTYDPISTEGNSTFEIPVSLDRDLAVSAQTIAMSEPHEIDYTLRFDSATMEPLEQ